MSSPRRTRRSTPSEADLPGDDGPEVDSEECSSKSKSRSSHHAGGPPLENEERCAREWVALRSHGGKERRTVRRKKTKTWLSKEERIEQSKVGRMESNVASI